MGVARRPAAAAQGGGDRRRQLGHRGRRPARPRRARGRARHPHRGQGARDPQEAARTSAYLPGVKLPEGLVVKRAAEIELAGCDLVCLAVPSKALPTVVGGLADRIGSRASVLLLSKGFVQPMGALPNDYVSERVRARAIASLGGPAHAREAAAGMAALVLGERRRGPAHDAGRGLRPRRPRLRADRRRRRGRDGGSVEERRRARRRGRRALRPQRRRDRRRRRLARVRRVRASCGAPGSRPSPASPGSAT